MKISAGKFKNKRLFSPKTDLIRPTTGKLREALFDILGPDVIDTEWLELFAGTGAIGLEALSRGAKFVTFVEQDRHAITCLKKNITHVGVDDVTNVVHADYKKVCGRLGGFDVIYADPPYGQGQFDEVILLIDGADILKPGGRVFIEETMVADLPALTHLTLKKKRQYGRSELWEFICAH